MQPTSSLLLCSCAPPSAVLPVPLPLLTGGLPPPMSLAVGIIVAIVGTSRNSKPHLNTQHSRPYSKKKMNKEKFFNDERCGATSSCILAYILLAGST
jgi:hypothetical protein